MARLIKFLTTIRGEDQQITYREYLLHIDQSKYHMPQYLELSRHISFFNI